MSSDIPVAKAVAFDSPADASYPTGGEYCETGMRNFLGGHNWPNGLQDAVISTVKKMPVRFVICDDSGSMMTSDGAKRDKGPDGADRMRPCTRWAELGQSLSFLAEMAHYGAAPTEFRFLNQALPIRVGFPQQPPDYSPLDNFNRLLRDSPQGGTPLCRHITAVIQEIRQGEEALRRAGQLACVIIATDGEANDGDLVAAMRPLKALPVWMVVRLCTNEDRIVEYWNQVDKELELNMEVLDDFTGEAREVHRLNPWLTYGEPLHRMREFGVHTKEVDVLDERRCEPEQVRLISALIFGGATDAYPHPQVDLKGFKQVITGLNATAGNVFSPAERTPQPWINLKKGPWAGKGTCVLC